MYGDALILMYHHVSEAPVDPGALCVSPGHFAEQLEVIRRDLRPMRLRDFVSGSRHNTATSLPVILTFDDGYVDNLKYAKPLLERYEIPSTVYVTTDPMRQRMPFWWDELEHLLLQPGTLPSVIELAAGGRTFSYDLEAAVSYDEVDARRHRNWRAWDEPPTRRHSLYNALRELLLPMTSQDQQVILAELRRLAAAETPAQPAHRPVTIDELLSLADGELVDIGAHTVTHPQLPTLSPSRQFDEIHGSRVELEELLGGTVSSFAYPYGDYFQDTVQAVRAAGFESACSTSLVPVHPLTDRYRLARLHVHDLDGDAFAQWLQSVQPNAG